VTDTNFRPIDTSRRMQEWVMPKGDEHSAMQAYIGETHSVVIFFHRERGSAVRVPFFVEHCASITDAGFCIWYIDVPNEDITAFLTATFTP
jgi:hypothetical protein